MADKKGQRGTAAKKVSDLEIVDEQELMAALAKLPISHEAEQALLMQKYQALYPTWHFRLRCGFSLLLYGFGSKRALIEDFASAALDDSPAVVVNGYMPAVNMKLVVYTVADALWEHLKVLQVDCKDIRPPLPSHSAEELLTYTRRAGARAPASARVSVLVHNADGAGLRPAASQALLGQLAACRAVQVVASIDHVSAPLLWDQQTASTCFNWWWEHTPTFVPYTEEGAHTPPLLVARGAEKGVRSALVVLRSLTPNARSIFRLLAKQQMQDPGEQGLPFSSLYNLCREKFLVSSELTLRTHLTEFKDHQVVRSRRADGQDYVYVLLPEEALNKLLNDLDND